ncbi:TetR/AcrR family transcriptional regulator [Actinomadura sp. KC345]|uniref:TetR/AcrR family transcriptional regulator n=1 Tax=Actinomadura sp. KC345 TaxID=2530371 RepID=UPI0014042A19|nr:TetR/AcrR family transcriptional regulator [Actinomadura sp. KC345]
MSPRRTQDRSRRTKETLVASARALFAERGYAGVSAAEIVAVAGLTRGALHHHFGDKRELFRAVLEQMEGEIVGRVAEAIGGAADSWQAATAGVSAFLDICEEPEVVQIALRDAPAVLGWAAWRDIEAAHGLGLIKAGLQSAIDEQVLTPQPVDVLAHLVLSAVIEAALLIAHAPDRSTARAASEQTLIALLAGLRTAPPDRGHR